MLVPGYRGYAAVEGYVEIDKVELHAEDITLMSVEGRDVVLRFSNLGLCPFSGDTGPLFVLSCPADCLIGRPSTPQGCRLWVTSPAAVLVTMYDPGKGGGGPLLRLGSMIRPLKSLLISVVGS